MMEKKENVTDVELPTTCNWVTFYCSCPSRPLSGQVRAVGGSLSLMPHLLLATQREREEGERGT